MPQFLDSTDADFEERFRALLSAKREDSPDVDATVAEIIADVRTRGDAALLDLTEKFDRVRLTAETIRMSPEAVEAAANEAPAEVKDALSLAAERIRAYHARQMPEDAEWTDPVGATAGLAVDPGVRGGALRSGRSRVLSFVPADERDPGQGRGRGAVWRWWCRRRTVW